MLKLYLECSSVLTGFLLLNNDDLIAEASVERHGDKLLIDVLPKTLATHGYTIEHVSEIIWGRGPGSFTGIRICATWIQAIAYVHACKVYPVCSFRARLWAYIQTLDEPKLGIINAHFKANQAMHYSASFQLDHQGLMLTAPISVVRKTETLESSIDLSMVSPTPTAILALHQQDRSLDRAEPTPVTAVYPQYVFDHFKPNK